jgi:hypothetical protein
MDTLELQLQNNIIMFARPTYPYVKEINGLSDWYDGEDCFHRENKIHWVLDAIRLRREIKREEGRYCGWRFLVQDIAGNFLFC